MSKLIDYKSPEAEILKPIFQEKMIDPFIAHVVESFIYKEVIDCNKDGIIVEKYMLKYGKKEGLYQTWYKNGQKFIECTYKEGKLDGICKIWHSNGEKIKEIIYKKGKLDGIYKTWYSDGEKMSECTFKDGKEEGLCKWWYDSGQWSECTYKDGKMDGLYQSWKMDKNGTNVLIKKVEGFSGAINK